MPNRHPSDFPSRDRGRQGPSRGGRRDERAFRGDDFYYGGARSQREDYDHRAFDNNDFDRREGMYDAGGRDFDERLRDYYPDDRDRGWWASHSPVSGERPWYEGRHRDARTSFTGGDRGWAERRHRGFIDEVKSFFGVGPKGYRRSDDRIREDVCEALSRHPGVDASDIEVRVKDGHVILTGTVENRWMKRQAEDAVEFVPGVEDVRVELTIPRNTDQDADITPPSRPNRQRKMQ